MTDTQLRITLVCCAILVIILIGITLVADPPPRPPPCRYLIKDNVTYIERGHCR